MSPQFDQIAKSYNDELQQQVTRNAVVENARDRVLSAVARPQQTLRPRWTAGITTIAAVLLLALWLGRRALSPSDELTAREGSGAVRSLNGFWIATSATSRTLTFSDDSTMRVEPQSNARITATGAHRATVQLERGRSSFDIRHHTTTRWIVEVGPFRVHVVGTRFDVHWIPEQQEMRLSLAEGQVRVVGGLLEEHRARPAVLDLGLRLQEVGRGDDADDRLSLQDGKRRDVAIRHLAHGVGDGGIGADAADLGRHEFGDAHGRILG